MAFCIGRRLRQPPFRLLGTGSYSFGEQRPTHASLKFRQTVSLALPDHDSLPAEQPHLFCVLSVPESIVFQLWRPIARITFWNAALTTVMSVPKTPMD